MLLRDNTGIDVTSKEVRKDFPAVFNHKPSQSLSDKYQLYRSDELIDQFKEKGFKLVEIGQQVSRQRNPSTQLHTLRFQPLEAPPQFGVNDSVPEVVILNGHDGRNRFRAMAGIFRFICSNGMVVSDMDLGTVVRRHFGANNTFEKVSAIVGELPDAVNKMHGRILDWSALELSTQEQTLLALELIKARQTPDWVTSDHVLEARREADKLEDGSSLWSVFNVLQENLTNFEVSGKEGDRRQSLRPVRGAYRNLQANEALWTTADQYYKTKVDGLTEAEYEELTKLRRRAYDRNYRAVKQLEAEPA